jgi:endoglycosylceramidase
VVVHGINMVYKLPPYFPAAAGFGDDDAAFLASLGFNAVRVGVIWKAVEPRPGVYDNAYLSRIASTVRTLARHGIVSLLDFHQDMLNERFQGEGIPDWAVQDGGLPNPKLGFPANYLGNPALEHALDAFFSDAPGPGGIGLQARFAGAWQHVAARFPHTSSVLGYEIFNEPFPGTRWEPCALPAGCPAFDAELTAFYRRVDSGIRAGDPHALVWYEPNVLFNNGPKTSVGRLGDRRVGFAFHDYCLTAPPTGTSAACDKSDNTVFTNAVGRVAATGDALMETEFGATNNVAYLRDMVARGDRYMIPWLEWAYCGCEDPTTTGPGAKQAIVINPAKPPTGSNLELPTLRALVEPYPQIVAGTPRSWGFDRATRRFTLRYSTARASGSGRFGLGALTEIATPRLVYRGRYAVQVTGAAIVSRRGASVLRLATCPPARTITVKVVPAGRSHGGSCLRLARPPKR